MRQKADGQLQYICNKRTVWYKSGPHWACPRRDFACDEGFAFLSLFSKRASPVCKYSQSQEGVAVYPGEVG